MLSGFVRFCDLAIQAEQRRVLQRECSGERRLLQLIKGILLPSAAHRECRGHEAPAPRREMIVRLVRRKGGCSSGVGEEWSRGGGVRVVVVLLCACLLHLLPLVSSFHRPSDSPFSISCRRAGRPSVNTAQAPPTKHLKRLWSFIHRPPPYAPSKHVRHMLGIFKQPGFFLFFRRFYLKCCNWTVA